ncbi:TRAP transporter large permease [candidate division KSB1 bacterium]|nr:TRAP transporter large permease [candidate division KSB1 bacterium]RQW00638.1 MAG: TRAP transporter large permease [candidate division KSB1 bacterium]
MTPIQVGILGVVVLLLLLAASMPVAFAMGIIGFLGFSIIVSPQAAMSMIATDLFDTISSYSLTVIPLFVLMGQVALHAGISRKLFDAAYHWVGFLPGGMAIATVGACTGFGAICGSGPATAATMASVALPEMKRFRYSMQLATGAVAAGGGLGMLIPPSVVFICYAIMTEQSIGQLFLAGILPGILIAVIFSLTIWLQCKIDPRMGPVAPKTSLKSKLKSLLGVFETVLLFLLVMGGMFAGFFTPTEAAAIGAGGSLVVAAFRRKLTWRMLAQSLRETARTSCMVLIIVAGAVMFGHFLAVTRIPFELANWLATLPLPGWVIISFIILFFLLAGCFVDALALIMLTIPIFYPVVTGLGFDAIWFGVIIVVVTQMGVISPPVGVNVYVVSGIERDVPLQTVFKGSLPFLLALVIAAAILVAFPIISLWLPNLAR